VRIKRIEISGFKSIANLLLEDVTPYSVFAGANGAGKSNLADALAFVSAIIEMGATKAIRKFNGFHSIHCYKLRGKKARTFEFKIDLAIDELSILYELKVHYMNDLIPFLEEHLHIGQDRRVVLERKKDNAPIIHNDLGGKSQLPIPDDLSALVFLRYIPIYDFLTNIKIFRFDPLGAKEPDSSSTDASGLHSHGHNVATMLATLEKNDDFRTQIIDWMTLIVPSMEKITTKQQRLDNKTFIKFKEEGTKAQFPASLVSDGTIYALCIMTAVLSRSKSKGLTIIEEPERGIHPQAIGELVQLMRENASIEHPVFVTSHSESVVRASKPQELWLVNKEDGKTDAKNAAKNCGDLGDLNLDKAWLMNFFNGGLPW
jgi:predicted ATPase